MLEEVRISSLGVIDEATLELSAGFTALTGETGAGKTMVVTALGLLFGGKADPARVRPGSDRATVEGRLVVPESVAREVEDAGGDLDDGATLVLSRTVSAEGRSRAFAGGRSVPVSLLQVLADDLVAVHGQADQRQLLKPGWPRDALDRFGGPSLGSVLAEYRLAYERHRSVSEELAALKAARRDRYAEAEALRAGLALVEELNPAAGEDVALAGEEEKLANADALHSAATTAHEALLGDPAAGAPDAVTLLGVAGRALDGARAFDPVLAGLGDRLNEAAYLVSDIAAELASYAETVDFDPGRLASVQERRAGLGRLVRAYGGEAGDVAGVLDWAKQASARLLELDGDDDRIGVLSESAAYLEASVASLAASLTSLREECSSRFASMVTAELAALAMPHARLTAVVSPLSGSAGRYGPFGADEVEFRLAPHPGAPPLPLHKGASGGELSRVMLAIEVVFAGADPLPTFVFDEVDAGVGGKAAVEIGRRLARLARSAQVIVVTHLPQVAAFADSHLVVEKSSDGLVTSSGVVRLDQAGRVRELSRMLAGLEDSSFGRAHAEELLALAAADRAR